MPRANAIHSREVSMMTVITLWPGVTAGGMVTSGRTVRGARRTNDSLSAVEAGERGVGEVGGCATLQRVSARWSRLYIRLHGQMRASTHLIKAEMMELLPTPSSPTRQTLTSRIAACSDASSGSDSMCIAV